MISLAMDRHLKSKTESNNPQSHPASWQAISTSTSICWYVTTRPHLLQNCQSQPLYLCCTGSVVHHSSSTTLLHGTVTTPTSSVQQQNGMQVILYSKLFTEIPAILHTNPLQYPCCILTCKNSMPSSSRVLNATVCSMSSNSQYMLTLHARDTNYVSSSIYFQLLEDQ